MTSPSFKIPAAATNDVDIPSTRWQGESISEADWARLTPGTEVVALKLAPDGSARVRYPGLIVGTTEHERWIEVEAHWSHRPVTVGGLCFEPGDLLREYFSSLLPFNVFAVFMASGSLRGWYANVTYPTRLDLSDEVPLLIWHDLYLDLVAFPDGRFRLLDDDELAASGLPRSDPVLSSRIIAAGDELVRRFEARQFPFSPQAVPAMLQPQDTPA